MLVVVGNIRATPDSSCPELPTSQPLRRIFLGLTLIALMIGTGQTLPVWLRWFTLIIGALALYVRQLRDWKGSLVIEAMDQQALSLYGQLCGATLAHAHARSGDRIAIASYLGRGTVFDRAILAFSEAYAEQNDRDYKTLVDAAATGRIHAESSY